MRISAGTRYLIVGVGLMVLSVVLAFLMVLQILPSTFLLNGLTFLASVVGLVLGIVGVAYQVQFTKNRR